MEEEKKQAALPAFGSDTDTDWGLWSGRWLPPGLWAMPRDAGDGPGIDGEFCHLMLAAAGDGIAA